jgi:hypothetical protein
LVSLLNKTLEKGNRPMATTDRRTIVLLDALAFASLALGILGGAFFWLPPAGFCLSALGLLAGFLGWVRASLGEEGATFSFIVGSVISLATFLLNFAIVTGTLGRIF